MFDLSQIYIYLLIFIYRSYDILVLLKLVKKDRWGYRVIENVITEDYLSCHNTYFF